ncbi:hypothetical protein [Gracilibacillus dipsosauri]|uniref:YneQ n=1 Tax=Gracilibacillus dipsosauri TaxID=178340 RepID=A0A317L0J3_9BACI|nr:hypothetical protein [Gracilibacillus dipsosauri]PWU68764.1 hypothetical protein DLJ74_10100 [Gracilibacillus dipsosauri]
MAFGIDRNTLNKWKRKVDRGEIAFLTHYWLDDRFPGCTSVTKVGCNNYEQLSEWGSKYGLREEWIHRDERYPHFDLFGDRQKQILFAEEQWDQLEKFHPSTK